MSFLEHRDDGVEVDLKSWKFWRTVIIFFCVFSWAGHTVFEWPYCAAGATFFGSVSWDDEVLANPLKPYLVYGIATTVCFVFLIPFKHWICERVPSKWRALLVFYVISVFLGMAGELIQGFLQNQPVDGVYPLWDVHDYPGNILGQAWIVNDIFLGLLITVGTYHIVPKCHRWLIKIDDKHSNILCAVVVAVFAILMVVTYVLW